MRLYLIRHGQTVSNAQKRYISTGSSPFTEEGKRQWNESIDRLIPLSIHRIYSSPSERCLSQARMVARIHGMEPVIDERLREMDFGIFEGLTWQEASEKYPKDFKKWSMSPDSCPIRGGESQLDLDRRTKSFIDDLKARENRSAAVFSHGGAIMSIISQLLELDTMQKWRFKINPGTIVTIEIEEGYAYLVL